MRCIASGTASSAVRQSRTCEKCGEVELRVSKLARVPVNRSRHRLLFHVVVVEAWSGRLLLLRALAGTLLGAADLKYLLFLRFKCMIIHVRVCIKRFGVWRE